MDINEIIERLKEANNVRSESKLCAKYGLSRSLSSSWKRNNVIPYELIVKTHLELGYSIKWLIYGEKPEKIHVNVEKEIILNNEKFKEKFFEVIGHAILFNVIDPADDYEKHIMKVQKELYEKTIQIINLNEINELNKA